MSSTPDPNKFANWLKRNHFRFIHQNKHQIWELCLYDKNKQIIFKHKFVFNMHCSKGQGIRDYEIKQMALKLKFNWRELKNKIINDEDINLDHLNNLS